MTAAAAPIDIQLGGPILRTSSDVAAPDPTPQTGFLENLNATREEMELAGNTNAATENARSAYSPIVDALEQAGARRADGRHYLNPADLPDVEQPTQYGGIPSAGATKAEMFAEIRRHRLTDKGFLAGVPDTPEAYDEQIRQRNAAKLQRIRGTQAGASRLGAIGGFVGGVIGSAEDPVNLWTMPFGGGAKTLVGAFARSALENMLVETVTQPFTMRNYGDLGEDYGAGDAARSVLFAGALGGAFGSAGHGVGVLARDRDQVTARIFEKLPEPLQRRWADSARLGDFGDEQLLVDTIRATVPEERWTSEQKHAVNVIEREAEVRSSSPFEASPEGGEAHAQGLAAALQSLIDGARKPVDRGALLSSTSVGVFGGAPIHANRGALLSRDEIIRFTMHDLEGGAAVVPYSQADGGTTKFGIAAKFHKDVDVANLTERQAADLYRQRYWFAGLDQAPTSAAAVAFDAGVISGPKVGQRILAASGGDPERAIALYRAHLNHIADTVPGKAKYRHGWNNRVDKLARKIGAAGDGRAEPMTELAELGEQRGVGDPTLEDVEAGAIPSREQQLDEGYQLDGLKREEGWVYEPLPILKRELFQDDDSWIAAQMRIGDAMAPQSRAFGPLAREEGAGPPEVAETSAGAPAASDGRLVFHGTNREFDQFELRPTFRNIDGRPTQVDPQAFFFAEDADTARMFAEDRAQVDEKLHGVEPGTPRVNAYRLRVEQPFDMVVDAPGELDWIRDNGFPGATMHDPNAMLVEELQMLTGYEPQTWGDVQSLLDDPHVVAALRAEGFDAVRLREDDGSVSWAVFDPDRIVPASEVGVQLDTPALERFADPDGEGSAEQIESLEHDARMDADAEDGNVYRLSEDGPEQTTAELLAEIEADEAAADALRACLAPPAKAAA